MLVAIDGSKTAENGLEVALDLAEKNSGEILIVSVFDFVSNSLVGQGTVFPLAGTTKFLEELETFHERILEQAIKTAQNFNRNLKVSKKLLTGRAAEKIVETANQKQVDLIVIGSRGLGGIKEIFLGSVSDRVVDEAKCPVLIIKENKKHQD